MGCVRPRGDLASFENIVERFNKTSPVTPVRARIHHRNQTQKGKEGAVRDTRKLKSTMGFSNHTREKHCKCKVRYYQRGVLITITMSVVKIGREAMQYMLEGGSVGSDLRVQRD